MYTESFIKLVKEVYPSSAIMIQMAEDGSYLLGQMLKSYADVEISPERILQTNDLNELKRMAARLKERRDLYDRWVEVTQVELPKDKRRQQYYSKH